MLNIRNEVPAHPDQIDLGADRETSLGWATSRLVFGSLAIAACTAIGVATVDTVLDQDREIARSPAVTVAEDMREEIVLVDLPTALLKSAIVVGGVAAITANARAAADLLPN